MSRPLRLLAALALLPAAAPAPLFTPGLWDSGMTMTIETVKGSKELAARLQSSMPAPRRNRDCYDAEMLSDPANLIFGGTERGCRFDRLEVRDGHVAMTGDCADTAGIRFHIEGEGRYDPGRYDVAYTGTAEASGVPMTISGKVSGTRAGECPAR
jgi:hypothetical protein